MTADERRTLRAAVDARQRELEDVPEAAIPQTKTGRPAKWKHGTSAGYRGGCRCDDCRVADTDARRLRREAERASDPRRQRLLAACADGSPVDRRVQVRAVMRMLNQAARRDAALRAFEEQA